MNVSDLPKNMRSKICVSESGCWEWTGALNGNGYSCVGQNGASRLAHRVSYELLVGPIPDGLTIDHLCRNRPCVNPSHLEPVTGAENTRRMFRLQTRCVHGHPLSGENLRRVSRADGLRRVCITCRRETNREYMREYRASGREQIAIDRRNQDSSPTARPVDDIPVSAGRAFSVFGDTK